MTRKRDTAPGADKACSVLQPIKQESESTFDDEAFANRDAARRAEFQYVDAGCNRGRPLSGLGYRSPLQAEQAYLMGEAIS